MFLLLVRCLWCCVVFASFHGYTLCVFFFNDTATTEIYTLSLHDALPICAAPWRRSRCSSWCRKRAAPGPGARRSEEHTSELQSHSDLVCRLLLEKKKIESEHSEIDNNDCPQEQPERPPMH